MINPSEHKIRRRVLAPVFSPEGILGHASWVENKIEALCDRFGELTDTGKSVNINKAFKSFTTDVISKIALGRDFGMLSAPDFDDKRLHILHETIRKSWTYRGFPIAFACLMAVPQSVSQVLFEIPILQIAKVSTSPSPRAFPTLKCF